MRILFAAMLILALGRGAVGQTDAAPKFDVSSVKPAAPDARGMFIRPSPGGTLNITNMPLKEMIVIAYRVQPYQVVGATGWMEWQRFDVIAKPEHPPKDDQIQLMLQALLAERFGLALHRETKELPIYALVMAKSGGKPGPALVETKEGSCAEIDRTKPMPPPPPPGQPGGKFCGSFMMSRNGMRASGIPLANFAGGLSRNLGRLVVDKTGLTGKFDIDLKYSPDESQAMPLPPDGPKPAPSESADPPLLTAIQEQLGLKLQPQKGPVEILVIDKASKPEEN